VRNDGELHQRPRAGLAIRRGTRTLYRGAFPMENVLPSTEREIELVLPIRLPAGRYTAVASTRLGPHASRRTSGFELTGTNRLPTPRLSLAPLQVTGLHTGESPAVHATLANRGSGPGSARVRFSAGRLGAGLPLETKLVQARKLTAGDHRELTARFAALPNGRYQLAAELIVAGRVVDSRRLNVEVRAPAGLPDRLRDWLSAHALMALLTLALMFAAVGVVLVRRRRPVAAPPAPVPTDELADLRRTLERLEARAAEDRSRKSA
jgi:hypothetical protein